MILCENNTVNETIYQRKYHPNEIASKKGKIKKIETTRFFVHLAHLFKNKSRRNKKILNESKLKVCKQECKARHDKERLNSSTCLQNYNRLQRLSLSKNNSLSKSDIQRQEKIVARKSQSSQAVKRHQSEITFIQPSLLYHKKRPKKKNISQFFKISHNKSLLKNRKKSRRKTRRRGKRKPSIEIFYLNGN
ncbi:unnamed protein product [Moneuplotes crassus]|uniref:Uncharacterized protein n=1 Tax=Euplotes crassus TaxID=5936 RepID=A0AAD1XI89_EUPCR|nr:unnamed protein product [Moneuplotes crassus]